MCVGGGTMNKLSKELIEFNEEREWGQFHTPENLVKSISIEAGELLECFQWDNNYKLDNVKDELADIVMYSMMLAERLDLDLEEIIKEKLERNKLRYPVEKAKGNSKKYTEFDKE